MQRHEATRLIGSLMRDHGLLDQGWTWGWDRAVKRMGQCQYGPRRLSFSWPLFERNGEDECRDTILHEIAHALVGPGHGHGPAWKAMARQIGANPSRCYGDEVNGVAAKYVGTCRCPNKEFKRQRLTQRARQGLCPTCRERVAWRQRY